MLYISHSNLMRLYTLGMIGTGTIILINFIVLNYVIQKSKPSP